MTEAMRVVDSKYEKKEYFIVDVASSASAMREAFKIFQPHLKVKSTDFPGKVVIGSLKGNIQSMGKDIVTATLRAAGFQVVDLGVDVSPEAFVKAAIREKAQIIGVSISVDETVPFLKEIVDRLHQKGLRAKVKIVIGGRAVSEKTCKEYGVDAYAEDAWDCVRKVRNLTSRSKATSHAD
jgi:methylmalonyl-CoA mutase cobalamin-binding domain/chain